jgi:hypothetical protein
MTKKEPLYPHVPYSKILSPRLENTGNELKEGIYTTYEVNPEGFIVNEKPKTIQQVYDYVRKKLQSKYPEVFNGMDYFSLSLEQRLRPASLWDIKARWTAVYYVTGGSEGWYIHVETRDVEQAKMMFLGKTFQKNIAEEAVTAISEIMEV